MSLTEPQINKEYIISGELLKPFGSEYFMFHVFVVKFRLKYREMLYMGVNVWISVQGRNIVSRYLRRVAEKNK
jgi:hypothetical protein